MALILTIFLRVNCPNLVQFKQCAALGDGLICQSIFKPQIKSTAFRKPHGTKMVFFLAVFTAMKHDSIQIHKVSYYYRWLGGVVVTALDS